MSNFLSGDNTDIKITGFSTDWMVNPGKKELSEKRLKLTLKKVIGLKVAEKIGDIEPNITYEQYRMLFEHRIPFEEVEVPKKIKKEKIKKEKILNCPYCQSKAELISVLDPGERTKEYVECTNNDCAASGPLSKTTMYVDEKQAAIEAIYNWNHGPRSYPVTG